MLQYTRGNHKGTEKSMWHGIWWARYFTRKGPSIRIRISRNTCQNIVTLIDTVNRNGCITPGSKGQDTESLIVQKCAKGQIPKTRKTLSILTGFSLKEGPIKLKWNIKDALFHGSDQLREKTQQVFICTFHFFVIHHLMPPNPCSCILLSLEYCLIVKKSKKIQGDCSRENQSNWILPWWWREKNQNNLQTEKKAILFFSFVFTYFHRVLPFGYLEENIF